MRKWTRGLEGRTERWGGSATLVTVTREEDCGEQGDCPVVKGEFVVAQDGRVFDVGHDCTGMQVLAKTPSFPGPISALRFIAEMNS